MARPSNSPAGDPKDGHADNLDPLTALVLEELIARGFDETTDPDEFARLAQPGMLAATDAAAEAIVAGVPKALRRRRRHATGFEKRLRDPWGSALDLLEALIEAALAAGHETNKGERPGAVRDNDLVFDALVRIHARACLTANEVLVLLKAGLPSGANARWRTLHELTVVAAFIRTHGQDVAERYLLHDYVSRARGLADYQFYAGKLSTTPFTEEEAASIRRVRDELCARFGNSFAEEYGWAAAALGNPRPNFRQIEEATELDHWRPYFRMASHGVHAGPHGLFWDLGKHGHNLMLAGPSNAGLADPGMDAAMSLDLVTLELLMARPPTPQSVVWMKALTKLAEDARGAFFAAHETLERRIREQETDQASVGPHRDAENDG
jgi:hypothetical protein